MKRENNSGNSERLDNDELEILCQKLRTDNAILKRDMRIVLKELTRVRNVSRQSTTDVASIRLEVDQLINLIRLLRQR